MAPLQSLALPHCLGLPCWHYQFLNWYLHQPESHQRQPHVSSLCARVARQCAPPFKPAVATRFPYPVCELWCLLPVLQRTCTNHTNEIHTAALPHSYADKDSGLNSITAMHSMSWICYIFGYWVNKERIKALRMKDYSGFKISVYWICPMVLFSI